MINDTQRWVVYTNNYCPLSCTACNTGCDKPLGSTKFRERKYDIPLNELELLLDKIPHNSEIRLVGGETTAMPLFKVVDIINKIHKYGCYVSLLTNGYHLPELLDLVDMNYRDEITLNNHGVNKKWVTLSKKILGETDIRHDILNTFIHYDLESAIPHSQGLRCDEWFTKPSIYDSVIYPCCSMMCLKEGDRDSWHILKNLGWTVYNPSWYQLFLKGNLPDAIHHRCLYECYLPNIYMGTPYELYDGV